MPTSSRSWSWREAFLGAGLGTLAALLFVVHFLRVPSLPNAAGVLLASAWYFLPGGAIAANLLGRTAMGFSWRGRILLAILCGVSLAASGALGSGLSFALIEARPPTVDDLRSSLAIAPWIGPLLLAHCLGWSLGFTIFRGLRRE